MDGVVIRLTNTRTGEKEVFTPIDPQRVRMYVCGPTVYDYAHIGNARPAVVFDVLFRLLRHVYGARHVIYARNITDIDDKIIARARETGEEIAAITARYAEIYHGRARRPAAHGRAGGDRPHPPDDRDDRAHDRARLRLCGGWTRAVLGGASA